MQFYLPESATFTAQQLEFLEQQVSLLGFGPRTIIAVNRHPSAGLFLMEDITVVPDTDGESRTIHVGYFDSVEEKFYRNIEEVPEDARSRRHLPQHASWAAEINSKWPADYSAIATAGTLTVSKGGIVVATMDKQCQVEGTDEEVVNHLIGMLYR